MRGVLAAGQSGANIVDGGQVSGGYRPRRGTATGRVLQRVPLPNGPVEVEPFPSLDPTRPLGKEGPLRGIVTSSSPWFKKRDKLNNSTELEKRGLS